VPPVVTPHADSTETAKDESYFGVINEEAEAASDEKAVAEAMGNTKSKATGEAHEALVLKMKYAPLEAPEEALVLKMKAAIERSGGTRLAWGDITCVD